ncbi:MAG TPA: anti-sigma factor [Micromonosporaceae bacterium]|jgi:hypothetical protein
MHLDHDELALLALDDTEPGDDQRVHLVNCADCRRAYDDLRAIVDSGRQTRYLRDLPPPPTRVWERIADEIRPSTSPVRSRRRLVLAAAVLVLLAALGLGLTLVPRHSTHVVAATRLTALAAAPASAYGQAEVVRTGSGTQLRVTLSGMPAPSGYYEAWLFDPATGDMYPMGPLTLDGGVLSISGVDLSRYTGVDISAQPIDDSGGHGLSMLRGTLR